MITHFLKRLAILPEVLILYTTLFCVLFQNGVLWIFEGKRGDNKKKISEAFISRKWILFVLTKFTFCKGQIRCFQ